RRLSPSAIPNLSRVLTVGRRVERSARNKEQHKCCSSACWNSYFNSSHCWTPMLDINCRPDPPGWTNYPPIKTDVPLRLEQVSVDAAALSQGATLGTTAL